VFRQFFKTLPWELEEAARIDGASAFSTWWRIMVPLAMPAVVVVFLFSVVWHWNDFFEPFIYLNRMEHFTLPMRLSVLSPSLNEVTGGQSGELFNEALVMAAVFLVILPPLSIYMFTQRFFVEAVDRTGLVE
jgi:multiple sugar transport system permease protein